MSSGPPPATTGELADALTGHCELAEHDLSPGAASTVRLARRHVPRSPRSPSADRPRLTSRVAAMTFAGKAALGLAVAGAGAVGAGVTGVLPDPAVNVVRRAIEAVTPIELPDASASQPASREDHAAPSAIGGATDRDAVERAPTGAEPVANDHGPPPDTHQAEELGSPTGHTSSSRSGAAPMDMQSTSESASAPPPAETDPRAPHGDPVEPAQHPSGSGHEAGGPPEGHGGQPSGGGPGSPGPGAPPSTGPGQHSDPGPEPTSGQPAGAGAPPNAGSPSSPYPQEASSQQQTPPGGGQPNTTASRPAAGPPARGPAAGGPAGGAPAGGAPAGGASSPSHNAGTPAAQPPGAGSQHGSGP